MASLYELAGIAMLELLWLLAGAMAWLATLVLGVAGVGTVLLRRAALAERQNHAAHARLLVLSERAVAVEDGAALVWANALAHHCWGSVLEPQLATTARAAVSNALQRALGKVNAGPGNALGVSKLQLEELTLGTAPPVFQRNTVRYDAPNQCVAPTPNPLPVSPG